MSLDPQLQPEKPPSSEVLVITGMSGAGRRTAAHAMEDLGWYVVDNLPPQLLPDLAGLVDASAEDVPRLAAVVDVVDDGAVVERFIKERSTLLRVRSPYVVAIRDVVIEGSTFAIVMDYVNGGDLRDLLRAYGCLPPAQVASLGTRIAQGLSSVHQAGVIHRDIKPANIMVTNTGAVKVMDFGIARAIADTAATIPGLSLPCPMRQA